MANPYKILIIDDNEEILNVLYNFFRKKKYDVASASNGLDGLKLFEAEKDGFDLVITDLVMPNISGVAKGEEADIVTGLELGADDYVTKPFSPRILIARVRAVIRRKKKEETDDDMSVIQVHDIVINSHKREIIANGKPVDLTFTEFQVLYYLAKRPGWVFTRTQIVDAVRGDYYPVTDRSVDVQIVGLRKKLGSCGRYIETVRGVGYRFRENP